MIYRNVEYVIGCDNDDCRTPGCHAFGWFTRKEAEEEAAKHGWAKCTRKRWLCPECAKKLLPAASR